MELNGTNMSVSIQKSDKILDTFREKLSTAHMKVHVIHSKEGWSVRKGRSAKAYRAGRTYEEALAIAKTVKSADEIIIHRLDGKLERIAIN